MFRFRCQANQSGGVGENPGSSPQSLRSGLLLRWGLDVLLRLILNSWAQAFLLPQPSE
jgi:hypothetical protein